jgi:hypothetical protein
VADIQVSQEVLHADQTWTSTNKTPYFPSQEGVKSHIDWNSAAALEFLGPSAKDVNQQAQIQAVLANVATTIYDYKNYLVQHYIKVRCDDPDKFCPQTCDGRRYILQNRILTMIGEADKRQ